MYHHCYYFVTAANCRIKNPTDPFPERLPAELNSNLGVSPPTEDLGGLQGSLFDEGVVALQRRQQHVHPLQGGSQAERPLYRLHMAEGGLSQDAWLPVAARSSPLKCADEKGSVVSLDNVFQP